MTQTIESIKLQLTQLKDLHESGVLSQAQFDEGKATLERRILDIVLSGAIPVPAAAPAPPTAAPTASVETTKIPPAKASNVLLVGLAAGVVAIAAAGYFWKGTPSQMAADAPPAEAAAQPDGSAPHATNTEQIAAMTEKLAQRLKEKPNDAEGWSMLARSYSVLGRQPDALKAYEKAISLRKDDATLLADYADALAVKNNGSLDGEPMKQIDRALKIDPKNQKALALAGSHAFDKKDYAGAVKFWELLVKNGPPDNNLVKQIEPGLAEARNLAGLPPAAKPLDAPAKSPAASNATVSGTVTLSAAMAKQAKPEDTVFVFARPAEGARMPLAILRKQVKDLPLQFTLDDSMAMSPANALSGASKVVVGARVSKSGNAMPQPGDLSGQSAPVSVGASGLQIEIREAVKP
jgi:cytochrome c-type biogenesis protein CcmH